MVRLPQILGLGGGSFRQYYSPIGHFNGKQGAETGAIAGLANGHHVFCNPGAVNGLCTGCCSTFDWNL
ncbi:MAG: hypothetical protein KME45_05600 [Stenomitos rutilans HA7619-LM2]|nr:hypothetical protein [Stenomitos rutilans HA7619-LM2]